MMATVPRAKVSREAASMAAESMTAAFSAAVVAGFVAGGIVVINGFVAPNKGGSRRRMVERRGNALPRGNPSRTNRKWPFAGS